MAPIFLANSRATQSSDEAGILITKTILPTYTPGPYTPNLLPDHLRSPDALRYVPTLAHFCIKSLLHNVDLIDLGGMARVAYHPESHMDLLRRLIPFFDSETREIDLRHVDPRVWGALVQIYSLLPEFFATYTLPLSDTHITQLQAIRSTPDFTLITVLDLASCPQLSDDTIGELKPLTNLCVLDLSGTRVGSWGVRKLAMCLTGRGAERRGPWGLRECSLRGCRKVDDTVKDALLKFPLLSTVDLRNTLVTPSSPLAGFTSRPPASHDACYHPAPPLSWIPALFELFPQCRIFESKSPPHILHLNKLHHSRRQNPCRTISEVLFGLQRRREATGGVGDTDCVVVLHPNGTQALHTGHELVQTERDLAYLQRGRGPRDGGGWPSSREYDEENFSGEEQSADYPDFFDVRNAGGPFYDGEEDEEDEEGDEGEEEEEGDGKKGEKGEDKGSCCSPLYSELAQQNEVAADVTARDTAEHEARRFYESSSVFGVECALGLRGGALGTSAAQITAASGQMTSILRQPRRRRLISRTRPGTFAGVSQAHELDQPRMDDDDERSLMFFRTPPPFDSISDADITGPARRQNPNEVISAKRRKTTLGPGGPPKTLWHRLGVTAQDDPDMQADTKPKDATSPAKPLLSGKTPKGFTDVPGKDKDAGRPLPSVSMNPFLAKKKVHSKGHIPSLGGALATTRGTGSSSWTLLPGLRPASLQSSGSGSATLPAMFTAATNKPRSTLYRPKVELPSESEEATQPWIETGNISRERSGQQKGNGSFDMKAWATKAKKS